MTNLDVVLELRRDGLQPSAVFVDLVKKVDRDLWDISPGGIVTCEIAPHEALSDLDLRPLVGLLVFVNDYASNSERHRRLAALIAAIDPRQLVMAIDQGETWLFHRRYGVTHPRTETYKE